MTLFGCRVPGKGRAHRNPGPSSPLSCPPLGPAPPQHSCEGSLAAIQTGEQEQYLLERLFWNQTFQRDDYCRH